MYNKLRYKKKITNLLVSIPYRSWSRKRRNKNYFHKDLNQIKAT